MSVGVFPLFKRGDVYVISKIFCPLVSLSNVVIMGVIGGVCENFTKHLCLC